jgi:hypothetical protein
MKGERNSRMARIPIIAEPPNLKPNLPRLPIKQIPTPAQLPRQLGYSSGKRRRRNTIMPGAVVHHRDLVQMVRVPRRRVREGECPYERRRGVVDPVFLQSKAREVGERLNGAARAVARVRHARWFGPVPGEADLARLGGDGEDAVVCLWRCWG